MRPIVAAFAVLLSHIVVTAAAADTLRVGKAGQEAFSFVPVDIGVHEGFFRAAGLDIEISAFGGSAKIQQAMASDSLDIGLAAGPDMVFVAKGSPVKAVAALAGPPLLLVLEVRPDNSVTSIADLKGRLVSVSTVNSLTSWLVNELSRQQGWGVNGIPVVAIGDTPSRIAALKTKQVDGMVVDLASALEVERRGIGKILFRFGDLVKDFHIHAIFATDKLIAGHPDDVRAFLKGWFQSIAFMRAHKPETVAIAKDVMGVDADIAGKVYDDLMPMFSDDGHFDPKALAVIRRSFVELKLLPTEPDMSKLYTEAFLPTAVGH